MNKFLVVSGVFLFVLFTFSSASYATMCSAYDNRNLVNQLDCFCSNSDTTIVSEKVNYIGGLAEKFGLLNETSCSSAAVTILLTNQVNDEAIGLKLVDLGFDEARAFELVAEAKEEAKTVKAMIEAFTNNGLGTTGGYSKKIEFTISFSNGINIKKTTQSRSGVPANEMDLSKSLEIFSQYNEVIIMGKTLEQINFSKILNKVDKLVEIKNQKSLLRIDSCYLIDDIYSEFLNCIDSSLSDEIVFTCADLGVSQHYKKSCLESNPTSANKVKACGDSKIGLSDYYVIECLGNETSAELVTACGAPSLNLSDHYINECIGTDASPQKVHACGLGGLSDYYLLECIETSANIEKTKACVNSSLSDYYTIECLNTSVSSKKVKSCLSSKSSDYNQVNCMM